MPVEFLEEEAIADIAFIVRSSSLEKLFVEACETVFHLQTDTNLLEKKIIIDLDITSENYERLLYDLLADILYYRDADYFFGKTLKCKLSLDHGKARLIGEFYGDEFDDKIHPRWNDVKAITMHDFQLKQVNSGWEAYILVDI